MSRRLPGLTILLFALAGLCAPARQALPGWLEPPARQFALPVWLAPFGQAATAGSAVTSTLPTLGVPLEIPSHGGSVVIPVQLTTYGAEISSIFWSLDIDQHCLVFDPADANSDGQLDAIRFQVPSGFIQQAAYDAADQDGELDLILANYSSQPVALPSGFLVQMTLVLACQPAPGASIVSPVRFSAAPQPSFSSPLGNRVQGAWQDGSVLIVGESGEVTPLPTATATPVPPTATPTASATPTPAPPTATPSATPGPTSSATPTPTLPPPDGDLDGDGLCNGEEGSSDWNGNGTPNYADPDDDGDTVPTLQEGFEDADGSGVPNYLDLDANGNGTPDQAEVGPDPLHPLDSNHDGIFDFLERGDRVFLPLIVAAQ